MNLEKNNKSRKLFLFVFKAYDKGLIIKRVWFGI